MTSWWKRGIVYQIYPRSFMDSNGDGIGDLRGIASRLDYLQWLGIDAVWLSPIFPSPMADFGYDVSDYTGIYPPFGTLDDFDHLLDEMHKRDLKLILDLVPNHTSDQHLWFLESRSSLVNPKRDWYIWRDPKPDGSPPNNWLAYFGGPAWTLDAKTGQYYLHSFLPEQPDLNYHHPEVKQAIFDSIRFWLKRGVDGFRVDVIDRMIKDELLRDNPPNPEWVEGRDNPTWKYLRVYSENRPGIHDLIREFRKVFDEFKDRVMIGEIAYSTDPSLITGFYGAENAPEIHLPFNFALLMLPWQADAVRAFVDHYERSLPADGWANYVLGNHDQTRIATRIGLDQARVAAMMILTLRGTPFIYYGEELGMQDVDIPPHLYQDPQGINIGISRDHERTPMQWENAPNAGFSTGKPWLPVAPDYPVVNAAAERGDPKSMLMFYHTLLGLRRYTPALHSGSYRSVDAPEGCFVYLREHDGKQFLIALNFFSVGRTIPLPRRGRVVLSTHMDRADEGDEVHLRESEGVVVELL
jgi:alpha-glucosidase